MERAELDTILAAHVEWLRGTGGKRAYLSGANLTGANLTGANLTDANLTGANLSGAHLTDAHLTDAHLSSAHLTGAYLTDANLTRANLTGANLTRAYLTDANLTGANLSSAHLTRAYLSGANLTDAYLTCTCLDTNLRELARAFARACPADADGKRVVYRTSTSQHVGATVYEPGRSYDAPYMSWSVETECHPGIYAASLEWMRNNYPHKPLVRCHVYDGDWTITAKGAIRTAHLEVIEYVA